MKMFRIRLSSEKDPLILDGLDNIDKDEFIASENAEKALKEFIYSKPVGKIIESSDDKSIYECLNKYIIVKKVDKKTLREMENKIKSELDSFLENDNSDIIFNIYSKMF